MSLIRFLGPALCAGLLISCTSDRARVANKGVVQVNSHQLSSKDFAIQLARRLKDLDALTAKDPLTVSEAKSEIVRNFILRSLIDDWMSAKKIQLPTGLLDQEVEKVRTSYPDDLTFRRALAAENMSFSEWRESLKFTLVERLFFENLRDGLTTPSDAEIKSYFESNRDRFKKKERIYVRQIVVEDEAQAELLQSELRKKDFASYAKKYSRSPEALNGGVVGWIEKGTVEVFDAAFGQAINSISAPIKSPYGFHLIRVEKRIPASAGTLDEARPEIVSTIRAQREQAEFVKWLDAQIRSARILKDETLIRAMTVETKVRNE